MNRFYTSVTVFLMMAFCSAQAQIITTIAGLINPNPVPGTSIGMNPLNFVGDAAGNIYFPDAENGVVRKLSPSGMLTTVAGNGTHGFGGDGGPALSAQFEKPFNIARDAAGNLYISDDGNYRIRKITPGGIITTIAGNGGSGFSGDGGPAVNAQISPTGIASDTAGNIYLCDSQNQRIRKVSVNGIITTVAGNGTNGYSGNVGDGGPALSAALTNPFGIALDNAGNFFITPLAGGRIRKVTTDGIIRTIVGSGNSGFSGDGGPATSATLGSFLGNVAIDPAGNVYIADDSNQRIRKITAATGIISTIAGTGVNGYTGDGGSALSAQISNPFSVSLDPAGNLYFPTADCVRKITPGGTISTIGGNRTNAFSGDGGPAVYAQLRSPREAIPDDAGNVLFADANSFIRKIDNNGIVNSIAGYVRGGYNGDGVPATAAQLYVPSSFIKTTAGEIFIADGYNHRIRKVDLNGIITTIAGNGTAGYSGDGGPALSASLNLPGQIRMDGAGNIYFVQSNDHCIRKIATNGTITTIAGNGQPGFAGDGGQATAALLNSPAGLAIDAANNIFITDAGNKRIRRITSDGTINTIAGNGVEGFSGDGGNALNASFSNPGALAIDPAGNIYLCDVANNRIRKINTAAVISTVAGGGGSTDEGVTATSAKLLNPSSIALDAAGNIYVSDQGNNRVRKITVNTLPLQLQEFKTVLNGSNILCSWKTSGEINTHNFLIQRSTDGISFTTFGMITAKGAGAGPVSYTYTDYNAAEQPVQQLYYRLEMTDRDGKKSYSPVNKVKLLTGFLFSLTPNPAHSSVQVKGEGIKRLQLLDQSGRSVKYLAVTGSETVIDLSGVQKGIYTIQAIFIDGKIRSAKLEIQ